MTVYAVEYSTGLTNDWKLAQDNFPPQGTNTVWSDAGSESALTPRFSSGDPLSPYRFYRLRVERYMSNTSPVTVTNNNVSGGATLSGLADVQASATATQGVISGKLYVDGEMVEVSSGSSYSLPLETRLFPNGTHRISVVAQDAGGSESTEETNPATDLGATYGAKNVTVTFNNDISNVRLRHKAFRPDLGHTQHISAVWSSPRLWRVDISTADNPSSIFRSFSGDSTEISITWNGTDSGGGQISPQIVGYHFYDLGPGTPPGASGGGGGGGAPSPMMAAMAAGQTSYFLPQPPLPPPLEKLLGPLPPVEVQISEKQLESFLEMIAPKKQPVMIAGGGEATAAAAGPSFSIYWSLKRLGTVGVLSQGHHPRLGNYPTPSRGPGLGNVRMSSSRQFGPWGPLVAPSLIAADCLIGFPSIGYEVLVRNSDDFCVPADLRRTAIGGSNTLQQVNIGLFTGHSTAGRDIEIAVGHLQSYVPIYSKANNTMTFVKSSEMEFGSPNLKWMAFYSCNMFRDSLYRDNGIYEDMKNSFDLPMNTFLHVLQGFATENSVHPDMVAFWTRALSRKSPNSAHHTVLGAWRYVCLETQPEDSSSDANYSRSIYWPECAGDYIYGWGPQTEPDRDPFDEFAQAELLEDDQRAPQ
jgi:hypothetical protein